MRLRIDNKRYFVTESGFRVAIHDRSYYRYANVPYLHYAERHWGYYDEYGQYQRDPYLEVPALKCSQPISDFCMPSSDAWVELRREEDGTITAEVFYKYLVSGPVMSVTFPAPNYGTCHRYEEWLYAATFAGIEPCAEQLFAPGDFVTLNMDARICSPCFRELQNEEGTGPFRVLATRVGAFLGTDTSFHQLLNVQLPSGNELELSSGWLARCR